MNSGKLQNILVPTDLSEFAAVALGWAALFRRRLGARLTVLYAHPPWVPFDIMEGPAAYSLQTSAELRQQIARELREHVQQHLPGSVADVETRIVENTPSQAILDTAEAIHAGLIVMGTHGRTGWRRALLGSIAEKVVHHTDRPILCIPPEAPSAIGKILCPVNFTALARVALEQAVSLAETFDAELLVVHVTEISEGAADIEGEFAAWIEPHARNRCRYAHLHATGNAAEETIRLANEARADLIVLGSQHKRFADASVIGSTTERVIRFAKRPVLTVVANAPRDAGAIH